MKDNSKIIVFSISSKILRKNKFNIKVNSFFEKTLKTNEFSTKSELVF